MSRGSDSENTVKLIIHEPHFNIHILVGRELKSFIFVVFIATTKMMKPWENIRTTKIE